MTMNILQKFRSARRRTQFGVILSILFISWVLWPYRVRREVLEPPIKMAQTSKSCIELQPEFGHYKEAAIKQPGLHCAVTDFWQQRLYGGGHSGPAPHHHLVAVKSGDVTIDLRNHILHSEGHSSGIVERFTPQKITNPLGFPEENFAKNITIKNGVIELRGIGTAIVSRQKWDMYQINEAIPPELTSYAKTNIVLENLLIKVDNLGIVLEGDGNIIRNCIIESGGAGAIIMAGPNSRIEKNTIILKNPFIPASMAAVQGIQIRHISEFLEYKKSPHAAIALHQASGTVISGNRIEVQGKSATRHNIYLDHDSKNVRIEENTFTGDDDPVTLVDGSTAQLKNNVFEKKKIRWWPF